MAVIELMRRAFGHEAELLHDADGRPSIAGFSGHISISHCRDEAILAVHTTRPVGVDVETPRQPLVTTAHKWLRHEELAMMHTADDYLRAWTTKEAIYKASAMQPAGLLEIPLLNPGFTIMHIPAPGRILTIAIQNP